MVLWYTTADDRARQGAGRGRAISAGVAMRAMEGGSSVWQTYHRPATLAAALALLEQHRGAARPIAGGTDVLVELERSQTRLEVAIDLSGIDAGREISVEGDALVLGMLVTHRQVLASPLCAQYAAALVQACREVGAPQIRNQATIAGNLMTASPANDTITALFALDATIELSSRRGVRHVPLRDAYPGLRRTVRAADELLTAIRVPLPAAGERGVFLKAGLRRAQAIAVVNAACVVAYDAAGAVRHARIALGCVAPTVVRVPAAEQALVGQRLDAATAQHAAALAAAAVTPIDDVRGSAEYRRELVATLVARALTRLADGATDPVAPGPLLGSGPAVAPGVAYAGTIACELNGQSRHFDGAAAHTLLELVRQAGLTGTKLGCGEGECGSCTVWLDGRAVLSCLVPAGQAHGAAVTTIEGLARDGALHPLQDAFVACGAVQCGYCIPGFLMSGARLLADGDTVDEATVREAFAGNICRCTGYRALIEAVCRARDEVQP